MEHTFRGRLVARADDGLGYINYVFEDLEYVDHDFQYTLCVRFPNWNQGVINVGDEGFVNVRYVKGGEDTWYDGKELIPYKYTNVIFLKFIPIKQKTEEFVVD